MSATPPTDPLDTDDPRTTRPASRLKQRGPRVRFGRHPDPSISVPEVWEAADSLATCAPSISVPEVWEAADSLATLAAPDLSIPNRLTVEPTPPLPSTRLPTSCSSFGAPTPSPATSCSKPLGEGGMGIVCKARQVSLNRLVALKMILGGHRAGPKDLIRFLAEAEAVASIKHPNVVQVHEYGEADDRPFLAMEYLPGGTLAERLKRDGRLEPQAAAELVARLARAVQAAHDQGIVHRDLKPANVLFDADGRAQGHRLRPGQAADGATRPQTQAVMGTPAYMSPEQAQGKTKFVGPQADVYALGVILYECLTGTRPFDDEDTRFCSAGSWWTTRAAQPHVPGLPRDLELIALKCLAKDPRSATRPPLPWPKTSPISSPESRSPSGSPPVRAGAKWARRKPTLAAAYLLTFVAGPPRLRGQPRRPLEEGRGGEGRPKPHERRVEGQGRREEGQAEVDRPVRDWPGRVWADHAGRPSGVARQQHRRCPRPPGGNAGDLRGWGWRYVPASATADCSNTRGTPTGRSRCRGAPTACASPPPASMGPLGSGTVVLSGAQLVVLKGHASWYVPASFSPDGSRRPHRQPRRHGAGRLFSRQPGIPAEGEGAADKPSRGRRAWRDRRAPPCHPARPKPDRAAGRGPRRVQVLSPRVDEDKRPFGGRRRALLFLRRELSLVIAFQTVRLVARIA